MSFLLKVFTAVLLLFLFTPAVNGQAYTVETEHFTTKEGLSHNAVNSLYEDSRGLLWLCTRYGVNRFDGREFRHYTKEAHGIHDNQIQQVFEDPDGVLWFLTGYDGFLTAAFYGNFNYTLFDAYAEKAVPPTGYLPEELRTALARCHVYVQLPDKSLVFVSNEGIMVHYRGRNDYTINSLFADNRQIEIVVPLAINDSLIHLSYNIDQSNQETSTCFFSIEGKLIDYDLAGEYSSIPGYAKRDYIPLRISPDGWFWRLWDKQGQGLFYLTAENARQNVHDLSAVFPRLAITPDLQLMHIDRSRNRYFIDSDAGILMMEEKNGEVARIPGVHLGRYAFTDRAGNLYVIDQRNGLFRYSFIPNNFEKVGLPGLSYRGVTVGPDGRLWTAIDKGAYFRALKPEMMQPTGLVLPHNQTVIRDKAGNVWAGLPSNLTGAVTIEKQFLLRHPAGNPDLADTFALKQAINSEIWCIWEDPLDGSIWSANTHGKIVRTDPVSGKSELPPFLADARWHELTLTYSFVRCDDDLWISTSRGLYQINAADEIVALYASGEPGDHDLPASSIHHVYVDTNRVFWLATGDAGLLKWSPDGKFPLRQYTLSDGFPSMVTHAVYEDSLGYLWIPTEDGIVQFHKITELVRVYRPEQGTSDTEYNRISHYRHPDGTLYFGGITGLTKFHPRDFHQTGASTHRGRYIKPIDVLRYDLESAAEESVTKQVLQAGAPLVLTPAKPRAVIQLLVAQSGVNDFFITSRLSGERNKEQTVVNNRLRISDLPYGKHQLVLRAKAIDGRLLEERSFEIVVIKPFYLRWWFLSLAVMLLVAAGFAIAGFENRRLRSLVRERTQTIERDKQLIEQQAKELRELDGHKSRFFANISHELRTPLTLIIGPVKRLLQRQDLPANAFDGLRRAHSNGERLQRMVNDILDLSKLEEGKLQAFPEPTPIGPFLVYLCGLFVTLAEQNELLLTTDMRLPEGLIIEIDRQKAETIVRNLLANAIKFTPAGGQVKLGATWESDELSLSISDTGQGIDERDLPKLFDRFYQARHGTSQLNNASGTGIGLAICRELTLLMNGKISVKSTLGEGSVFELSIPSPISTQKEEDITPLEEILPAVVNVARPQVQATTKEAVQDTPRPGLLVVEDNPDLRDYLEEILQDHYQVTLAGHGGEALAHLKAADQLPDLIITDLMMPEMDGFELLRTLKKNQAHALIPTIALSSRSAASDRLNVLSIGIDDYILKPFDEKELLQRIRNLLTNAQARTAARTTSPAPSSSPLGTEPLARTGAPAPAAAPYSADQQADAILLNELRETILANLDDPDFGNEELAALHFISPRTLSRRIKSMTGLSTNKFMLEIRLNKARELLEASPRPNLSTLAENVGFKKASYFSARFRERFGILPSEYAL